MNSIFKIFLSFALVCIVIIQLSRNGYSEFFSYTADVHDSSYLKSNDSLINQPDSLNAAMEELKQGRILYEKKCQKCHKLHNPKDYRLGKWKENLREMKDKAELTKGEYKLILGYLAANCKK